MDARRPAGGPSHRGAPALLFTLFLVLALWALTGASRADAAAITPPKGKIWHGVSDTGSVSDFRGFERQTRSHPAILQALYHWDVSLSASGAFDRWEATDTLGVVSLSTTSGEGDERIKPRGIAQGRGDHYILRLNESIANSGQRVLIRLMPEMNGHWNRYSAFGAAGKPRPGASTRSFTQAWKRFSIIVRGGSLASINKRLGRLGMPRVLRASSNRDERYERMEIPAVLDRPQVGLMWVPQTTGSPNVHGNSPGAYWPGRRYVDWVGADIFAKFGTRTVWRNLNRFYERYRGLPFVVGEYSPYDGDPGGRFTRRLHGWAQRHPRVRSLLYYRSVSTDNAYGLHHYPGAKQALREILDRKRYQAFAPGVRTR
ncbi:hypothetical protein HJD18_14315 [Thermoleophilia bacterium SCSIO 60948]|nr:hypothetical protein HJD18_14315 [Thermoleophilia bacterium SCSIO 60948]